MPAAGGQDPLPEGPEGPRGLDALAPARVDSPDRREPGVRLPGRRSSWSRAARRTGPGRRTSSSRRPGSATRTSPSGSRHSRRRDSPPPPAAAPAAASRPELLRPRQVPPTLRRRRGCGPAARDGPLASARLQSLQPAGQRGSAPHLDDREDRGVQAGQGDPEGGRGRGGAHGRALGRDHDHSRPVEPGRGVGVPRPGRLRGTGQPAQWPAATQRPGGAGGNPAARPAAGGSGVAAVGRTGDGAALLPLRRGASRPDADGRKGEVAQAEREAATAKLVGARGFEPPTPCSQSRCATRLRYAPTTVPLFTVRRSIVPSSARAAAAPGRGG